ncbi:hypothetical protein B0H10DRAFT_2236754 [Mycena sp. CBHHK59/15]|nr:hypothetical protein B0H10DRAFT_2236754 [Mycena sp. CBHHK59/15]
MARTLRRGRKFSPYDLQVTPTLPAYASFALYETGISLEDSLTASIAAASACADELDAAIDEEGWEIDSNSEDVESALDQPGWDDEEQSHPIAPLPGSSPSTSSPIAPVATANIREAYLKKHDVGRKRAHRQKKHQECAHARGPYDRTPLEKHSQAHRTLPPEHVEFDAADLQTAGPGAWVGPRRVFQAKPARTAPRGGRRPTIIHQLRELQELLAEGYQYIQWDGKDPLFILDQEGRIVGTPEDPDWPAVIADMVRTFTQARKDACDVGALSAEASLHRRGN